ncbi:hypothetical protein A1O1_01043 [Capronia coronata CBS 617.96]|uniref:A to I editase domain-containing protein n=1 Tax=Capronia coronata CBS 617.96 TaxID=1182541 RepID=W9YTT4_9EURO|nr:uncharacterized protein A1O1_01043 [Capronia coronata CBS 617.96]EXJ95918.1 hypothetical protein A1O1_01043 [Capronia coronata CBS 617.96]
MPSLAEQAASLALSTFDSLPQKCKPRTLADGRREWTPMAAVVLAEAGDTPQLTCVSLATGTKCLAASALPSCRGSVLHDCHAEILALRGFNYWLLAELQKLLEKPEHESSILESAKADGTAPRQMSISTPQAPYRLKSTISIYFFTTEAPCGDASMEILMSSMPPHAATPWSVEDINNTVLQGRGHFSLLGHVRRKPARADAEPSLSKSCTDKLALKQFTSIISFPADLFVQKTENAFIRTTLVYADQYNSTGYRRAFSPSGRLLNVEHLGHFFDIVTLPPDFPRFLFSKDNRSSELLSPNRTKASNISALWIRHPSQEETGVLEVLINGVKQGYKQWDERPGKASVVSRRSLWETGIRIAQLASHNCGSSDGSAISCMKWHMDVSQTLCMNSYCTAKSTVMRSSHLDLKQHVREALGNWTNNRGDDEWSLC